MDEDPFATRPHDMLPPNHEISQYVALRLLDFPGFGCSTMEQKRMAFDEGIIINSSRAMHEMDWTKFAKRTDMSDTDC